MTLGGIEEAGAQDGPSKPEALFYTMLTFIPQHTEGERESRGATTRSACEVRRGVRGLARSREMADMPPAPHTRQQKHGTKEHTDGASVLKKYLQQRGKVCGVIWVCTKTGCVSAVVFLACRLRVLIRERFAWATPHHQCHQSCSHGLDFLGRTL